MAIYFHIAHPSWKPGQDIVSYSTLVEHGVGMEWKWGHGSENDADVVSLFEDLSEAEDLDGILYDSEPGTHLLRVDLPVDVRVSYNNEEYPIVSRVKAEWITELDWVETLDAVRNA